MLETIDEVAKLAAQAATATREVRETLLCEAWIRIVNAKVSSDERRLLAIELRRMARAS